MNIEKIAAVAMLNDQQRAESISHNLANANTPGYKATVPFNVGFELKMASATPLPQVEFVPIAKGTAIMNIAAGPMQVTNSEHDIAVEGNAWLELAGPSGSLYTRAGHLHVSQEGVLLGPGNLPLMGENGPVQLSGDKFSVKNNGEVTQDGAIVARLRRIHFDNPSLLMAVGNQSYAQGAANITDAHASDPIRTKVLESSNVDSTAEMIRLTETVRHFESLQKIVQNYDDVLGNTIRKLGDF